MKASDGAFCKESQRLTDNSEIFSQKAPSKVFITTFKTFKYMNFPNGHS